MAFTPQGTLATGNGSQVTVWGGTGTAKPLKPYHLPTPKGHTTFVANGHVSSVTHVNDTVTRWTAANSARTVTLRQPTHPPARERPPAAAFAPDGETLAFATGDGKATLRSTSDPAHPLSRLAAINTKGDWVQSMAYFPKGRMLVTVSYNNTVTLGNVTSPTHPVEISRPRTGTGAVTTTKHGRVTETSNDTGTSLSLAAVSPDGETLAICDSRGAIRLWDVTDPAQPVRIGQPINADADVNSVAFTPDSKTLVTGTFQGTTGGDSKVKIWRL